MESNIDQPTIDGEDLSSDLDVEAPTPTSHFFQGSIPELACDVIDSAISHLKSRDILIPILRETDVASPGLFIAHVANFHSEDFLYLTHDLIMRDGSGSEGVFGRLARELSTTQNLAKIKKAKPVRVGPFHWEVNYIILDVPYLSGHRSQGLTFTEISTLSHFFATKNPPIEFQVALGNALAAAVG